MKRIAGVAVTLFLVLITIGVVYAQQPSAAERLDELKLKLIEAQTKEEMLRSRAAQLELELKPENIERSLAGIGSTKPEELREYRRRQLTIERDAVVGELKIVENQRGQLESAIATTQAQAYQESAGPIDQTFAMWSYLPGVPILLTIASAVIVLLGAVAFLVYVKRQHV